MPHRAGERVQGLFQGTQQTKEPLAQGKCPSVVAAAAGLFTEYERYFFFFAPNWQLSESCQLGTDELLAWRLTSGGISLQVLKRGEIILTISTFRFNPLYKGFWGAESGRYNPSLLPQVRHLTLSPEGRSETEGCVGFDCFPSSMSPQGWDFPAG